jgi:hypothetical protein
MISARRRAEHSIVCQDLAIESPHYSPMLVVQSLRYSVAWSIASWMLTLIAGREIVNSRR